MNLAYHGRTYGTMALTSSGTIYKAGFGPLMGGTFVTPFPYVTRGPYGEYGANKTWPQHETIDGYEFWGLAPREIADKDTKRCLDSLELLLRTQTAPMETAAILLEPVLGEGGYVPCPPGFLTGLRNICDKHGMLLIADEVQTGFGRTGNMFSCEWLDGGVKPDIIISAKGLANGFPLSAVATRSEISCKQPPGSMGGTYGGNAVSVAASLAVLEAFEKENVLKNVMEREKDLRTIMKAAQTRAPGFIREIRGRGLMLAVEFEPIPGLASGYTAGAVAAACHSKDLLVMTTGPYETIRFMCPLNISKDELVKGVNTFLDSVEEVHKAKRL
jgi:4-aminobutyrate aminotransferase